MDLNFIWQAILIVLVGTLLLRLAGRKTISEMTLAETVLMISFGTLIIQPVTSKSVWKSFLVGAVLVITLLVLKYGQIKSNRLEKIITGKSKIIIENGILNEKEMLKLHLTVDQLEMYLRQNNISSINDVEWATIEPSGKLGFTLKNHAQPATKADIEYLQKSINKLLTHNPHLSYATKQLSEKTDNANENSIFTEIKNKEYNQDKSDNLQ